MSGRPWLVVGGTGFVGSAIVRALRAAGVPVVSASRWSAECLLDATDTVAFHEVLRAHRPEGVILASGKLVGPEEELRHHNVLPAQAALEWGEGELVLIGSAAEYGEVTTMPVDEGHPCRPVSAYGRSKWEASQRLLESGRPATLVRPSNVVGPGMPPNSLLAQVAYLPPGEHQFEVNRLDFVRDFVAVNDVAAAVVRLRASRAGVVHVGRGVATTLPDITQMLAARGVHVRFTERTPDRQTPEGRAFVPCIDKLVALTGFRPETPLEEALWTSI